MKESSRSLETFIATNNGLTKECGSSIAKFLSSKGHLKLLNLSNNNLGDAGVGYLCSAFSSIDVVDFKIETAALNNIPPSVLSLILIDLSNNQLGDSAVLSICKALTHFACRFAASNISNSSSKNDINSHNENRKISLKVIRLDGNHITDKGALCFSQLLLTHQKSLVNTCTIEKNGNSSFSYHFRINLRELSLNNNRLTTAGLIALHYCI